MQKFDVIIIGAGISGLTIAERYASLNKKVLIIEKRNHIAGNCYDYFNEDGILVSKYGHHYFHTNDKDVWEYINLFGEWIKYEHKVIGHIDNKKIPIPINIKTVEILTGLSIKDDKGMESWLLKQKPINISVHNAEDAAISRVGEFLYSKVFKEYTEKQWGISPKNLSPEITNRIPIRVNYDDRYFTDEYQAVPVNGYTKFFESMIENKNITILLNTKWEDVCNLYTYEKLFFTGRIDLYYKEKFGKLQYRSLRFEFETFNNEYYQDYAQENYLSKSVPFTRIVEYKHSTFQKSPKTTISREYPTWEGEPFYPVLSPNNFEIYDLYKQEAFKSEKDNIYFVGRLANYKYFNMDQSFKNALDLFNRLEKHKD